MNLIQEIDRSVLAAINKGEKPDLSQVADPVAYFTGLLQRQGVGKSWAVAGALADSARSLCWDLDWMIESSYSLFGYDRAQQNQDFLFALKALQLDLNFYSLARKSALKHYDCYPEQCGPSARDIHQANAVNEKLDHVINLCQTLMDAPPPTVDGIDPTVNVAEALPIIQGFKAFYPEFMKTLDDNKIVNLTGWSHSDRIELPKLEIALPSGVQKAVLPWARLLDKQVVRRSASDFQGFCIGIVQEPGNPEDRDLHKNWMSPEDVELACDRWAFRHAVVGVNHEEFPDEQGPRHPHFVILRNWIQYGETTIGGQFVKDRTWLQAYQAVSEWAISALENFEINGLSPGGSARFIPD